MLKKKEEEEDAKREAELNGIFQKNLDKNVVQDQQMYLGQQQPYTMMQQQPGMMTQAPPLVNNQKLL